MLQASNCANSAFLFLNAISLKKLNRLLLFTIRSFLIALFIVALGTYAFFCPPVLTTFVPGLILCPPKNGAEYNASTINNVKIESVEFGDRANVKLHGWFLPSSSPNAKVMLFCHGNGGNIAVCQSTIARWHQAGVSVFAFDYQGYGHSSGKPKVAEALKDGESAYNYLINAKHVAPKNILLYGQSFGGAVACDLAKSKDAAGLVVESGFSNLLSVARKKIDFFKYYPEFLTPIPALDNAAAMQSKHMPLLLIHGTHDEVIPVSEAERNFALAAQPKQYLVLPHSGHFVDAADLDEYTRNIGSFVSKL